MQEVQLVIGHVKILANVYQTTEDVMVKWIVMMAVMNIIAVSHMHMYNIIIVQSHLATFKV